MNWELSFLNKMRYNFNYEELDRILEIYSKAYELKKQFDDKTNLSNGVEKLLSDTDFYTAVGKVLDEAEQFPFIFFNFNFPKKEGNNLASKVIFPLSVAYNDAIAKLKNDPAMISQESLRKNIKDNKREVERIKRIFLY